MVPIDVYIQMHSEKFRVSLEITNYQLIIVQLLKNYKLFKIVRDENLRICIFARGVHFLPFSTSQVRSRSRRSRYRCSCEYCDNAMQNNWR